MGNSKKRLTAIFFLQLLFSSSTLIANPKASLKNSSSKIAYTQCVRKLHQYYSGVNPNMLNHACHFAVKLAKPDMHYCIDRYSLINLTRKNFNRCMLTRLKKNKPLLRHIFKTVITACVLRIKQFQPDSNNKQLVRDCSKSSPGEVRSLIRHFMG